MEVDKMENKMLLWEGGAQFVNWASPQNDEVLITSDDIIQKQKKNTPKDLKSEQPISNWLRVKYQKLET